ncbi:Protein STE50 [Teratosphaeria destructans]|uniref:Protein STE50 n=1 Tax=Teratosphaeria destructans TaxID=418781 RepID=A0A9W7W2S4_9PEZI|nr:Protein STE50 [Teratosphaeria destructans]
MSHQQGGYTRADMQQMTFDQAYGSNTAPSTSNLPTNNNSLAAATAGKGAPTPAPATASTPAAAHNTTRWFSRVSHRASHIPSISKGNTGSRETLTVKPPGSAGGRLGGSVEQVQVRSSSPASPADTDFGTTPIDASFGSRTDEPTTTARPSVQSLRSRSGTVATIRPEVPPKNNPPSKGGTGKMDKYGLMAGDDAYETDGGDADDEYERLRTMPTHYDDEDSDHPSESEEEHDSVDGEDTPTTQGWGESGRSPMGHIRQWTEEQVADYILSLSPAFKQYCQTFADEGVNGEALGALTHDELRELGVASVGHRLTILKAVYEAKLRAGVKIDEGDYIPPSAEGDRGDEKATQDDIARVIESIGLRDQRIIQAESQLRALRQELERISDEYRKFREETLPVMRLMKDQRTPLPDPSGGNLPSPREIDPVKHSDNLAAKESKGSSLSRKFSTKKLFLGSAPKQQSPTYPSQSHTPQPREVRDDPGGTHLEASAAAMAASSHLTASMTSQTSPNSVHGQQLSPTSPAYNQAPSSGGSYHAPGSAAARSFPRNDPRYGYSQHDEHTSGMSQWSQATTAVGDAPVSARQPPRRQAPTPSPREDETPQTAPLPRDRGDRDNPQVEIFKSFRVSIEDPCRVVLPVALKRYNITDDWRQYALYIVHGDQERCLGLEEKPLMLFKQLDKEGRKPMFMLRRHASPQEGWSGTAPASHQAANQGSIPGGVL